MEQNRAVPAIAWMVQARESDERLRIAQGMLGAPALLLHVAQGKAVTSVALSLDGTLLASGDDEGNIRISEVSDNEGAEIKVQMPGQISRLSFSPDGSRLAAANLDGQARLWSANGQPLSSLLDPNQISPGFPATDRKSVV